MAYLVICNNEDYGFGSQVRYREVVSTLADAEREIIDDLGQKIDTCMGWDHIETYYETHSVTIWNEETNTMPGDSICWWPLDIGDDAYAVIKGMSLDGGGIEVNCIGHADSYDGAHDILEKAYKDEVENPSFYAGWDDEYSYCFYNHARLTVETRDMVVDIRIVDTKQCFVGRGFDY